MDAVRKSITEIESRFLIFAQIGTLKIDYVSNYFAKLKEKLELETSTAPVQSPFGIMVFPALYSPKITIQFLEDHIEIIEKNPSEASFDLYREITDTLYGMIRGTSSAPITRLAVNGLIRIDDEQTMEKIYQNTFKQNAPLMLDKQDSWGFRLVDIEDSSTLGGKINRCITIDKVLPEDTPDGKVGLIVLYDYNTKVGQKIDFSPEKTKHFINAGEEFKNHIIDEVQK